MSPIIYHQGFRLVQSERTFDHFLLLQLTADLVKHEIFYEHTIDYIYNLNDD